MYSHCRASCLSQTSGVDPVTFFTSPIAGLRACHYYQFFATSSPLTVRTDNHQFFVASSPPANKYSPEEDERRNNHVHLTHTKDTAPFLIVCTSNICTYLCSIQPYDDCVYYRYRLLLALISPFLRLGAPLLTPNSVRILKSRLSSLSLLPSLPFRTGSRPTFLRTCFAL